MHASKPHCWLPHLWDWEVLAAQSCLALGTPVNCSPPGSSVHEILQARTLEWGAISFSRESSWPKDQTWVSHIQADSLLATQSSILLGEVRGQRSLVGYSPWGCRFRHDWATHTLLLLGAVNPQGSACPIQSCACSCHQRPPGQSYRPSQEEAVSVYGEGDWGIWAEYLERPLQTLS